MIAPEPADKPPARSEWVGRCAARIRLLDDIVTLLDAADLATTLYDLPCCEGLTPEAAAARLFQDNLTPSQWNSDLAKLCRPVAPTEPVPSEQKPSGV